MLLDILYLKKDAVTIIFFSPRLFSSQVWWKGYRLWANTGLVQYLTRVIQLMCKLALRTPFF